MHTLHKQRQNARVSVEAMVRDLTIGKKPNQWQISEFLPYETNFF